MARAVVYADVLREGSGPGARSKVRSHVVHVRMHVRVAPAAAAQPLSELDPTGRRRSRSVLSARHGRRRSAL